MKKISTHPFVSGHKTFDKLVAKQGIYVGNVWGDAQFSGIIRSAKTVECNGFTFEEGHLRGTDLQAFGNLPHYIRLAVLKHTEETDVILYRFSHYRKVRGASRPERIDHGYVITYTDEYNYAFIEKFVTGPTYVSGQIIDHAVDYIAEEDLIHTIDPHKFIHMNEIDRAQHEFFVGKRRVASCSIMRDDEILPSVDPKRAISLIDPAMHVRIGFTDGSEMRTNYGCRIRVEMKKAA